MRKLLKQDQEQFNFVVNWIEENRSSREPNFNREKLRIDLEILATEVEHALIVNKMSGGDKTAMDLIRDYFESYDECVVVDFTVEQLNDYLRVKGIAYPSDDDYLHYFNERKYYSELENLATEYLSDLDYAYDDDRNFFEIDGNIYYGIRSRNEYDARLLGEVYSYIFIMTSKEYDEKLNQIKMNYEKTNL